MRSQQTLASPQPNFRQTDAFRPGRVFVSRLVVSCVLISMPTAVQAHIIQSGSGGFGSGFEHPLTGPDHFLAMFAVGLWGAQIGGRSIWTLPVAFPLIMVLGGIAGIAGIPLPGVEIGIALSIIALGLAIACAWRPAEWMALLLIAVFAICHGYAHGAELPNAADPADYAIGFVIATGLIHLLGIGVGLVLGKPFGGRLSQVLGGLIAVGGIYFLVT
ncbi:HupE/UreJ family protein [Mesorhizobium sp. ESP7-2]|uniref:HupE/UreJ family protein n=1 Tax=Mesorhizobium sp. ESP7-2 TaxID=2876622 RepID=UPI0029625375|nr:HupE/UreJ family protein [Mesorhizobium sp. ESP7-2]